MVRSSLVMACVLGLWLGSVPAQETREKTPGEPAKKGEERAPAGKAAPAPVTTPSPAPGGSASGLPDRTGMGSRLRSLAESILKQHDKNKNGVLERDEWSGMPSMFREADRNGDGIITVEELAARLAEMNSRIPERMRTRVSPPVSVEVPSPGGPSFSRRSAAEMPGMTSEPLNPLAPMVRVRVLIAELAADQAGSKSPAPNPAPAGPPPGAKLEGLVDLDLSASDEKLKEDLGKMGLRGRWEFFRNLQVSSADGQVTSLNIGQSEPQIAGVTVTQFGRTNMIQYRNAGLVLGVQPHVGPGGIITARVDLNLSRSGSDEEGVPIATTEKTGTAVARPVHKVLSQSVVRVPDGKTVAVSKVESGAGGRRRVLVVFLSAQVVKM